MKISNYHWQELEKSSGSSILVPALKELKLSEELAPLLWQRKIRKIEDVAPFFYPALTNLYDPFLLYDMQKVVDRIQKAIMNDERILIYGDYDADGITSTSVMKEGLELIGANVQYYLPNRFDDGYGPNIDVYKYFIKQEKIDLIITVDNGVSGHEAIAYAKEVGVDVIVTDHHELPETLPDAYAIIHPKHPEGNYPFEELAGVGVAFKVVTALLGEVPVEALDLVAIGTIADLVSLTDENRVLVKLGLDVLRQTDRMGLQSLVKVAELSFSEITEETVGFSIGPRLNAIGRLGDAMPGVELLTTFDDELADHIAQDIDAKNKERKEIVAQTTKDAFNLLEASEETPFQIIVKKDWHEGVLGIVASQIVQKTQKPTLVMSLNEETGIVKGSGRSIEQIDLFNLLNQLKDDFISFGGHHMAAGLSFEYSKLAIIQEKIKTIYSQEKFDLSKKETLSFDGVLDIKEISLEKIESFNQLGPFGTDNPVPYFKIKTTEIKQLRKIGMNQDHLKLQACQDDESLDCIAFSFGEESLEFESGDKWEIIGHLTINEWNGRKKPQLMIKDYQVLGTQIFDQRGKHQLSTLPNSDQTQHGFVIFTEKFATDDRFVLFDSGKEDQFKNYENLTIVECPPSLEVAQKFVLSTTCTRWFLECQTDFDHYLEGIPSREIFGKLFKLINQQPSVDIRYKLPDLIHFLKIDKNILIFMIQVFFELGFVTIEDGLMKRVENPPHRALDESKEYQAFLKKIDSEKLFVCSNIGEIKQWIDSIGGN
ncbi:single-stranded-DNA-specific exonuclease RecJ [Vagococcus sp.]|uniref:single-stranded-DNA-specific exonuclease RecJ n=1 Tax=Vagococcus sp. TaxID=1933889 RepID=UPI003F948C48